MANFGRQLYGTVNGDVDAKERNHERYQLWRSSCLSLIYLSLVPPQIIWWGVKNN